jgi:GntR family transcriptional regulator
MSPVRRPLDRESSVPLWAQLEAELRRRVDAGDFDERFPTDMELTREYEVSRHTVREAIRQLNGRGLLQRVRGRGTVLNRAEFEQPLGALYSLFESIERSGVEQRSQVLALEPTTDSTAAGQLGLAPDAELVLLARVRWAGDAPLAVDRAWLPAELGRPLLEVDFTHTALYDELERTLGIRPNEGWERITPIVPTPEDRRLLGLAAGDAAFFLQRSGQRDGHVLEWRTSVIRGDRYRFVARWSAGATPDLRLAPAD